MHEDGILHRHRISHRNPALAQQLNAAMEALASDLPLPFGTTRVIETGESQLFEVPAELVEHARRTLPSLRDLLKELEPLSLMAVPLRTRGRILGALTFATTAESGRRFTKDDVVFAEEFSSRCALAIENAQLFARSQRAIRARDEFLSIASHELKTPLTPLQLQIENIRRSHAKTGTADERTLSRLDKAARQVELKPILTTH